MATIDVLIPTYRRKTGLAIVLTSLLGQTYRDFDVIVSDQTPTDEAYLDSIEIQTLAQALEWHGHRVRLIRHLPAHGLAEQRQFLLDQSTAPYVHYIDDDVILDPPVLERMLRVLQTDGCGFVGCLPLVWAISPTYARISIWSNFGRGPVVAEPFTPETVPWDRHKVNNAANPLHLEQRYCTAGEVRRYKIAWVGGANVLFDRAKLDAVGAFRYWPMLPAQHAGEEVVVQWLLLATYGGCGILPSGTYHLGLPTTVIDRQHNATQLFGHLLERYVGHHERAVGESKAVGATHAKRPAPRSRGAILPVQRAASLHLRNGVTASRSAIPYGCLKLQLTGVPNL
ncbi:glycosyltransferase [Candidatus Gracilibacteria bacterium]|nr:glycosyltransferase [Candidatus Gracilibacteria bacterium]